MSTQGKTDLYIGTMSGTSADGLDINLCQINSISSVKLIGSYFAQYPSEIKESIQRLQLLSAEELFNEHKEYLATLDEEIGLFYSHHISHFLEQEKIPPEAIDAIGSHGQTILHQPRAKEAFSLQIGNAQKIANSTGITVTADFRTADIQLGGEGAPLIPAFHHAVFQNHSPCSIINIGGISNVSFIEKNSEAVIGFDTGPGNTLMDQWIKLYLKKDYDHDGIWAESGNINEHLLNSLLSEPYFSTNAPKSTGQDLFNLNWLNKHINDDNIKPNDVQRTLLELTAITIFESIQNAKKQTNPVFLCGGGALNSFLTKRIQHHLGQTPVKSTLDLGVDPQCVEAMGFAWLAYCRLNNIDSNLPAVTGAKEKVCLGRLFTSEN